jgi:hypothetical protein
VTRCGSAGKGLAWQAWSVTERPAQARQYIAGPARIDGARLGSAWLAAAGKAWAGAEWLGWARRDAHRRGVAGWEWLDKLRLGKAWQTGAKNISPPSYFPQAPKLVSALYKPRQGAKFALQWQTGSSTHNRAPSQPKWFKIEKSTDMVELRSSRASHRLTRRLRQG